MNKCVINNGERVKCCPYADAQGKQTECHCPCHIRFKSNETYPFAPLEIDMAAVEARVAAAYAADPCFDPYAQIREKHEAKRNEQRMRNKLEYALFNADDLQILEDFKDITFTVSQLKEIMVRYASPEQLRRLLRVYASDEPSQQEMNDQENDAFEGQR